MKGTNVIDISIKRNSKNNFNKIIIRNDDDVIEIIGEGKLKLNNPKKDETDEDVNLFHPLNAYLNMALDEKQHIQLFNLYKSAIDIVENNDFTSYEKEMSLIDPILYSIIEIVKPNNLFNFFTYSTKFMVIPKDLKKTKDHGYYPEETTFVIDDYIQIVNTTFLMRMLFPIFFGLVARLKPITGGDYAELICGKAVHKIAAITETYGWKRLVGYVTHSFNKPSSHTTSIQIENSEYTMIMILYRVLFNRLSVAVIPEQDPAGKSIIQAISSEVKQYENNVGGYNEKKSFNDEEDNTSYMDEHQITEETPMVIITQVAEYFSFGLRDEKDQPRFKDRFKHQCNGLGIKNTNLVENVYDNFPQVWDFQLTRPMVALLQLAFAYDVPERLYEYCNYNQLTPAIALGQVLLAERGYIYLPSLLCAQINKDKGQTSANSFLQLTAEDRLTLMALCDVQAKNNEGGSFNEAVLYVKELLEELESHSWRSNLEYGVLSEPDVYKEVSKGILFDIDVEVEIKNELIRLIQEINQ